MNKLGALFQDYPSVLRVMGVVASILAYFGFNFPQTHQEWAAGTIMLIVTGYGVWKNNYLSKKGGLQKKALQAQGLYKK